jgi:rhodanese-related sulfurtransferase
MKKILPVLLLLPVLALAAEVNITPTLEAVEVMHGGVKVRIERNQDTSNEINPNFAKTSRKCPPFCIQPGTLAPGVETIAELELLDFLQRASRGEPVIVVDSRTADWVSLGTIPGSVNISWEKLHIGYSDPLTVQDILEKRFGARQIEGFWNFEDAKTVVLFCNGPWCGQSPLNIKGLLKIGYPAHKLKWYRGGMQDWESLGFTTVKP